MLQKAYLAFGMACLSWYGAASLFGWEFGNPRRQRLPLVIIPGGAGYVGRSPGGSSSSHPGSTGFGGGK